MNIIFHWLKVRLYGSLFTSFFLIEQNWGLLCNSSQIRNSISSNTHLKRLWSRPRARQLDFWQFPDRKNLSSILQIHDKTEGVVYHSTKVKWAGLRIWANLSAVVWRLPRCRIRRCVPCSATSWSELRNFNRQHQLSIQTEHFAQLSCNIELATLLT